MEFTCGLCVDFTLCAPAHSITGGQADGIIQAAAQAKELTSSRGAVTPHQVSV